MGTQAHWEEVASARSSLLQRSGQVLSSQPGALYAALPVLYASSLGPQRLLSTILMLICLTWESGQPLGVLE